MELFDGLGLANNRCSNDGYPFTAGNNVNGVDDGGGTNSMTMSSPNAVTNIQDAYVQKVIDTVNDQPNVLWEVALREGYGLNTRFMRKKLDNGNTVYEVTDPDKDPPQTFTACLDEEARAELSKHYPLTTETLFICRDRALDDTAAANLALQCHLKTI